MIKKLIYYFLVVYSYELWYTLVAYVVVVYTELICKDEKKVY